MTTIREVAEHAGVSPATVSRVLNGKRVNGEMRMRVQTAVQELGYRPSRVARSLRTRSAQVWALIISDIRNPFFTDMARGIEDTATELGYSLVLCNADADPDKERTYVELIHDEQMAGCIITPAHAGKTDVSLLTLAGTPVVAVDRGLEAAKLDLVDLDNRDAAAQATRHLLAEGFERIACITGPRSTTTAAHRAAGYLDALDGDDTLLRWEDFHTTSAYVSAQSLLRMTEPPDAFLVGNNVMMIGVLRAIHDTGHSPRDFGLIGFDELPWADLTDPPLSTIEQPTYEIGATAARLLMDRINGDTSPPRHVTLSSQLHVRESSRRRAKP